MKNSNPKYKIEVTKDTKISLSFGNSKIGMMINWSTLPGDDKHLLKANGELLTDVPGTCCGKCDACFNSCYAVNSARLHHNACIPSWAKNTLMLRQYPDETFAQIDAEIRRVNKAYYKSGNLKDLKYKFVRVNVAGEIESLDELERWNALAQKHPELQFGLYSKNEKILIEFFKRHGQTADNFTINVSQWHGTQNTTIAELAKIGAKFNVFEYDDSNRTWCTLNDQEKARLASCSHCLAVTKAGKHAAKADGSPILCTDCGRCYRKTGATTAVYDH